MKYNLPVDYTKLTTKQRREVREQYTKEQNGKCMYCNSLLTENSPANVTNKQINWELFPLHFLTNPIHLQHNHDTGMTEGSVHAYCNAVLWQYHRR